MPAYHDPHTDKSYRFPGDEDRYLDDVFTADTQGVGLHDCMHGHYDCALFHDGPCSDEIEQELNHTDED